MPTSDKTVNPLRHQLFAVARDLASVLEDLMGSEGGEPRKDDQESQRVWARAGKVLEDARKYRIVGDPCPVCSLPPYGPERCRCSKDPLRGL